MSGDGSVLSNLRNIVTGKPRCGITSEIDHKASGGKRIGFRGVLQINPTERQEFVFTGFSYLPDQPETIGVMLKLAKIAQAEDRLILVYFKDQPFSESLVFHPTAYSRFGESETKNDDRRKRGERWVNLPREYACSLRELADHEAEPRTDELPKGSPGGKGWF